MFKFYLTWSDLSSRKLLWEHYRDLKNYGIKADFQLPLLSLLAHLTKTISISSVNNSQHWADKFSAQESAFWPQHLSQEAHWWRLNRNSYPKYHLHPAPKKESEYALVCHSSWYLFQTNSRLAESELEPAESFNTSTPMMPSWCPHHLLLLPEDPWMFHSQQMSWQPINNVYWAPTVLRA